MVVKTEGDEKVEIEISTCVIYFFGLVLAQTLVRCQARSGMRDLEIQARIGPEIKISSSLLRGYWVSGHVAAYSSVVTSVLLSRMPAAKSPRLQPARHLHVRLEAWGEVLLNDTQDRVGSTFLEPFSFELSERKCSINS